MPFLRQRKAFYSCGGSSLSKMNRRRKEKTKASLKFLPPRGELKGKREKK